MFVRRFVVAVVAAFLTIGSVLVVPAYAEPVWTPPERLGTGYESTLAGNDRGDAVAAWSTDEGLQVSVRPRGGVWGRPEVVPGSVDYSDTSVAIDRRGNVAVAFSAGGQCEFDTPWYGRTYEEDFQVRVAYRAAAGKWRVETIDGQWRGCDENAPRLVIDASGTVTAVWYGDGILAAQLPLDGAWTKPVRVGAGRAPEVAVGPDEVATIVWASEGEVLAVSASVPGRWSQPLVLGEADRGFDLAGDSQGNLVAVWVKGNEIRSALRPAGKAWLAPEPLPEAPHVSDDLALHSLQVALDGGGQTVVWSRNEWRVSRERHEILAATRLTGGSWGAPVVLSDDTSGRFAVAANPAGAMGVYLARGEGNSWNQVAQHLPARGEWSAPSTLDAPDPARGGWSEVHALGASTGTFTVAFRQGGDIMFTDFVDDSRAPSAKVVTPRTPVTLSGKVRVSWSVRDDLSGAREVDLRLRSADRRGAFSDWHRSLTRTTATSVTRSVDPGQTVCYSVRARDRVGNQGAWSKARCVTAPVDERAATASDGWAKQRHRAAYRGTLMSTDQSGARLDLGGVTARRIGIVARSCPGCGKVAVIHGGRRVATFDLASGKTRNKRVLLANTYPRPRSGKVVVRVISGGKPVHVDGFVALR